MPKDRGSRDKLRHDPLHVELSNGGGVLKSQPKSKSGRKIRSEEDEEREKYVNSKMSRKILAMAQQQQEEIAAEEEQEVGAKGIASAFRNGQIGSLDDLQDEDDDNENWYDEVDEDEEEEGEYEEYEELEMEEFEGEADEEEFVKMHLGEGTGNGTLADKIMEKIRQKEMAQAGPSSVQFREDQQQSAEGVRLPPKVIETYTIIADLLSRLRAGKMPKPFKMIPTVQNWQDLIYVTQPEQWTPYVVYQATRLFVSAMSGDKSKTFLHDVVLMRFREDVQENKKVNYHIYRALKKALYKPAAFFKGILFPLCDDGCTLREAQILGSVIAKISIPVLHSAIALRQLCEMDYSAPVSYFIKVLLDKKYAMPYQVVDACVFHFMRFRLEQKQMPTMWHRSFLSFVQRYKNDITPEQRDALLDTLKTQFHEGMGPEIRRELVAGRNRGEEPQIMEMD